MEEQTDTICIKEETAVSDNEGDTVRVTSPAEDVVKKETFDERGEMILCDDGSIKEEFDEGEGEEMEIAAVMLPEFVDEAFGNEEGNFPDDVLRVKTTTSLRPGPKSKKRKMLQSESSQDPDWNPLAEGSKLQNALLRNRSDKKPNLGAAIPARRLPATETSGEEADSQAFPVPTSRRIAQTYRDTEISQPDNFLYCHECSVVYEGDCPEHGPLNIIEDVSVPADIADRSRASKTAPPQVVIGDSRIPGAGCGVRAKDVIPPRTRLGPYEGISVPIEECTSYSWLIRKDGEPSHCVDATELGLSNWLRFVNCARNELERNLIAFQYDGRVYYRTVCQVDPGEELLVWCGRAYSRQPDASDLVTAGNIKGMCGSAPLDGEVPSALRDSRELNKIELRPVADEDCAQEDLASHQTIATGGQLIQFNEFKCIPNTCIKRDPLEEEPAEEERMEEEPTGYSDARNYARIVLTDLKIPSGKTMFVCWQCDAFFADRLAFTGHLQSHAEDSLVCIFCSERFLDLPTLRTHAKTHSGEAIFRCGACDKQFFDKELLEIHMRAHDFKNRRKKVTNIKDGDDPLRIDASDIPLVPGSSAILPYKCGECGMPFARKFELKKHEMRHGERSHGCDICHKKFFSAHSLKHHQKTHEKKELYQCSDCDKTYSKRNHLTCHRRGVHDPKVNPFECKVCNKTFALKGYLNMHKQSHKKEELYSCDRCDQRFFTATNLIEHRKTHIKNRSMKCVVCKLQFADRAVLKVHLEMHLEAHRKKGFV